MKTVLFVPGFDSSPDDYALLLELMRMKGYNTRSIPINWNQTTFEDWLRQVQEVYKEGDILAGHSLGAMTTFQLAAIQNPAALWLFSLSGRFSEDFPTLPQRRVDSLGPKLTASLRRVHFEDLVSNISCETLLFFGGNERQENPEVVARSLKAHARLGAKSKLVEAENAGHEPEEPPYLMAIAKTI